MYDLIDRPVAELAAGDRGLLDAMRNWVHALTLAGRPAVAPDRFADGGGAFDASMHLLDRMSAEALMFQRPCHPVVEETEAVMLSLWRMVIADRLPDAIALARLLVTPDGAPRLVAAMQRVPDCR